MNPSERAALNRAARGIGSAPAYLPRVNFDVLRARRDAASAATVARICEEYGLDPATARVHVSGGQGCYCACATGGPCEHVWTGWREIDDGHGGEQFCAKCGLGALSHSLRTAP